MGGKAETLFRLQRIPGIVVPPFFVVTSHAYDLLFAQVRLANKIEQPIDSATRPLAASPSSAAAGVGRGLDETTTPIEIPSEMVEDVLSAFDNLQSPLVAVRSSALLEDAEARSWAGQFRTELYVDRNHLCEAIRRVWTSQFSKRAIAYASRDSKALLESSVCVIVQVMVDPEFSGVTHTELTGCGQNLMTLESIMGQCELLVQGLVTPDTYFVQTSPSRRIVRKVTGRQSEVLSKATRIAMPAFITDRIKIPESIIMRLVDKCVAIEDNFGLAQDIEWAVADDQIFFLQSRPVTGLRGKTPNEPVCSRLGRLRSARQTEMRWEVMNSKRTAVLRTDWVVECVRNIPSLFPVALNHITYREGLNYTHYTDQEQMEGFAEIVYDAIRRDREYVSLQAGAAQRAAEEMCRSVDGLKVIDFSQLSNHQLARCYEDFLDKYVRLVPFSFFTFAVELLSPLVRYSLNRRFDVSTANRLFIDISDPPLISDTANEELELLRIVEAIQRDPTLQQSYESRSASDAIPPEASDIERRIEEHRQRWSWVYEQADGSASKGPDFHSRVISLVQAGRESQGRLRELSEYSWRARERRDQALREASLPGDLHPFAEALSISTWLRTYNRNKAQYAFVKVKALLAEFRSRAGLSPEEMLYVRHHQVLSFLTQGADIDRTLLERVRGMSILGIINGKNVDLYGEEAKQEYQKLLAPPPVDQSIREIIGLSASPGAVDGLARVITDLSACEQLQLGEILVTKMMTPDYVVIMKRAAAIVTDEGGICSHAAILSRELGIPCVVGTGIATRAIKTAESIRVDANAGSVLRL